jgi:GNAT superfamily N-acetyltransferase
MVHDAGVVSLRVAHPDDYPILAAMRYDFRAAMDEPDEDRDVFEARMVSWLEEHLRASHPGVWKAWLAFEDRFGEGEPIGMAFLHLVDKIPNPVPEPEQLGYITSVYVRPDHRGGGVGAALLDAALDECRARGLDTIVLWPSARSRSLYERRGFRSPGMVMELPLVDHPGRSRP